MKYVILAVAMAVLAAPSLAPTRASHRCEKSHPVQGSSIHPPPTAGSKASTHETREKEEVPADHTPYSGCLSKTNGETPARMPYPSLAPLRNDVVRSNSPAKPEPSLPEGGTKTFIVTAPPSTNTLPGHTSSTDQEPGPQSVQEPTPVPPDMEPRSIQRRGDGSPLLTDPVYLELIDAGMDAALALQVTPWLAHWEVVFQQNDSQEKEGLVVSWPEFHRCFQSQCRGLVIEEALVDWFKKHRPSLWGSDLP